MKTVTLAFLLITLIICGLNIPGISGTIQDDLQKSVERGKSVYNLNCLGCHKANGEGMPGIYPPLSGSDHLQKDQTNSIKIILEGQNETINVNGTEYNIPMAAFSQLTDEQVADVLNYIGNSWGNRFNTVMPTQVKSLRK